MTNKALFPAGHIVSTPGAFLLLGIDLIPYIRRHCAGDWGDLDEEDKHANDYALKHGTRLFSAYDTPKGKIWVITEADRSATTCLLPEEY